MGERGGARRLGAADLNFDGAALDQLEQLDRGGAQTVTSA